MNLKIKNLTKKHGKKTVLNNFNYTFENGVYGLLGPNGAGKTTLINIIVGLVSPTSGTLLFNDKKIESGDIEFLNQLGYLPQFPQFYKNYKAAEFLEYIATLKGISKQDQKQRIEYLLDLVNLSEEKNKKIGSFSGGMRQRLGIAQAMLNNPSLLILDEPTAGLDPKERIRFRNLISRISSNRTVILATHIVPDIEYIANNVILLGKGMQISESNPTELMGTISGKVWEIIVNENDVENYMQSYTITNVIREKDGYHLRIISEEKPLSECIPLVPSLEDVYLYYFGEEYSDQCY